MVLTVLGGVATVLLLRRERSEDLSELAVPRSALAPRAPEQPPPTAGAPDLA